MKNVLYLSYDGLTDPLGQSQILPYLVGLSEKGFSITIISFEKKEHANLQQTIGEQLDKSSINWIPLSYTKKPPVLSTILDVYRLKKKAFSIYRKSGFDIVHCRSYITSIVGLQLKKKLGVKFIFDMRGFWADERVEGGLWPQINPLFRAVYKYFKRKEKAFLANADYTVSLTHSAKDEILKNIQKDVQLKVIPCCVDTNLFSTKSIDSDEITELKRQLNGFFVMCYLGSLGTWYDSAAMIESFMKYREKRPSKFLVISKSDPELLFKHVKSEEVKQDIIFTSASREQLPSMLSLVDMGIFIYRQGYSRMACSPTKLGEMMAMGLPVLGNDIGDTKMILEKYNSGVLLETKSTLISEDFSKDAIRKGCLDYFSLDEGVTSYEEVYNHCFY